MDERDLGLRRLTYQLFVDLGRAPTATEVARASASTPAHRPGRLATPARTACARARRGAIGDSDGKSILGRPDRLPGAHERTESLPVGRAHRSLARRPEAGCDHIRRQALGARLRLVARQDLSRLGAALARAERSDPRRARPTRRVLALTVQSANSQLLPPSIAANDRPSTRVAAAAVAATVTPSATTAAPLPVTTKSVVVKVVGRILSGSDRLSDARRPVPRDRLRPRVRDRLVVLPGHVALARVGGLRRHRTGQRDGAVPEPQPAGERPESVVAVARPPERNRQQGRTAWQGGLETPRSRRPFDGRRRRVCSPRLETARSTRSRRSRPPTRRRFGHRSRFAGSACRPSSSSARTTGSFRPQGLP